MSRERFKRESPSFLENREKLLDGKVALVTGSSRDIGAAIAVCLAKEGISILGNYREKARRAGVVKSEIEKNGGRVEFVQADITIDEDRHKLEETLDNSFGGNLDFLILNASGSTREINVHGANALVDRFISYMREGSKIVLMQSVPGHYQRQLRGLDKIPDFYNPVAQTKREGEDSLRLRQIELKNKGISFFVVCPSEVLDTSNMRLFQRKDNKTSHKHAEISDMLGIPRTVTTKDVGQKIVDLLKQDDLPMGYVELFGNVLDARSILSKWYGDNAIFIDKLEINGDSGVGRLIVAKDYARGHFNERVGLSILPGHIIIEAAAQALGLIALNGKRAEKPA